MKTVFCCFLLLLSATCTAQNIATHPDSARIIHSDIANFWKAFDRMEGEGSKAFEQYYLAPGSVGVQHFRDNNRIVGADTLYQTVRRSRKDYQQVRASTLRMAEAVPQCRAAYYAFKYLYPQAKFPPLYFVIGRFNTGGLSLPTEQIIGAEMNEPVNVPYVVAHELIHANQDIPYTYRILLEQCLIEGSADFLGELISGRIGSRAPYDYAKGREAALWQDFVKDMNLGENDDFANWLYAGKRKDDRPADMGYYIGYVITRAYYDKAADKQKAIYDILHIRDCKAFLEQSGYKGGK